MIIRRKSSDAIRPNITWSQRWNAADQGLIACWEVGRELTQRSPDLAVLALAGELPVLGWKGGVTRKLKRSDKFGSLKYLAQWQGLRGEDLEVDLQSEVTLTCTRTGMVVTFTPDHSKYQNQQTDNDDSKEVSHERPASRVPEQPLFSPGQN
jgi:hypothetical protein